MSRFFFAKKHLRRNADAEININWTSIRSLCKGKDLSVMPIAQKVAFIAKKNIDKNFCLTFAKCANELYLCETTL